MAQDNVTNYNSVFGGLPGQTRFYFTAETLLACKGNKEKLWRSLQQPIGGREGSFWPAIREYKIKADVDLSVAIANANPQYGEGGGLMVYIDDFYRILEPLIQPQQLQGVQSPSDNIRKLLERELDMGNSIDYIDFDGANGKLEGIYLTKPLNISKATDLASTKLRYFHSAENIFCAPEAGVICTETGQYLSSNVNSS